MSEKLNNTRISCQDNRINNVENSETAEQITQSENQNVNYINYKELFISDYGSSDDNYFAMLESFNAPPIALQNMTITIENRDCHLLFDSGSVCTIINMSLVKQIMFNCMQAQWSEKNISNSNLFLTI